MTNPLTQFLTVDDRSDGVFITISRDKKDKISLDKLIRALDLKQVTNYDREKIESTVMRARGAPEKIGPPFEYYNKTLEEFIEVRIVNENAIMQINSEFITTGIAITPTNLLFCLKRNGIRFGFIEEAIEQVVTDCQYDTEVCVAKGENPIDGKNGKIQLLVDYNPNLRPHRRRDGSVDFRDVDSFPKVTAGQTLAKKIPPTNGTPGKTVTGELIPSMPGKDVKLPQGKNTELSDDGMTLVATKAGFLQSEGVLITVGDKLFIENDIDFNVGNVKFSGDVEINGDVKPGFSVESEGDILIHGQVESSNVISRNGSVTIKKSILGKNASSIYAKSLIEVMFAQNATLETEGTVRIERHCLHCQTTCTIFEAVGPHSNIVGGMVTATQQVVATQIGNKKGTDTKIVLLDKTIGEARKKLKEYSELKKKILTHLDPVKKQVKSKAAIFKKAGDLISNRQKAELKKWVDSYNVLKVKFDHIQARIDEITDVINGPDSYEGCVKVSGPIFPGTILDFFGRRKTVQNRFDRKTFSVNTNGEISAKG